MKATDLVTVDCEEGLIRRYRRVERNKPFETGRQQVTSWKLLRDDPLVDWTRFWEWLCSFRTAWIPPEDPGPRPTAPLRNAMRVAA